MRPGPFHNRSIREKPAIPAAFHAVWVQWTLIKTDRNDACEIAQIVHTGWNVSGYSMTIIGRS